MADPIASPDPDAPDLVPARMLNEFAYCPRLAYLEWVQGDFADSADTVEGRFHHRKVDKLRSLRGAALAKGDATYFPNIIYLEPRGYLAAVRDDLPFTRMADGLWEPPAQ